MQFTDKSHVNRLKNDLAEELSRLSVRIDRRRGGQHLEEMSITLSERGRYKGTHTGKILGDGKVILFDGFVGVLNKKTDLYDGVDFFDYVEGEFSDYQSPEYKADALKDLIAYIKAQ